MSNVEELDIKDMGGVPINKADFFRIDSLDFVKGLNLDLGTTADPNYSHFKQFADEMKSANIELINLNDIANEPSQSYDNLDLNGNYNSNFGNSGFRDFILNIANGLASIASKQEYSVTSDYNNDGYANFSEEVYGLGDIYRTEQIKEYLDRR